MSPGSAIANALSVAPIELGLVIGAFLALWGLLLLYRFIRRTISGVIAGGVGTARDLGSKLVSMTAFRTAAGGVLGAGLAKRFLK